MIRSRKRRRLPVALSAGEVEAILERVNHRLAKACLTTIYACGLRLSEGARLRMRDIDSGRTLRRERPRWPPGSETSASSDAAHQTAFPRRLKSCLKSL